MSSVTELPDAKAFSIGEAAAIVGVSTHVLRSWERRLSLALNHRTQTNQRRYWIEDIRRFIAIRHLHESTGLPLVESAARAMDTPAPATSPTTQVDSADLNPFWAGLIDALGDVLLVLDESGRVTAANEVARQELKVRRGTSFVRLAPLGWKQVYNSFRRGQGGASRRSSVLPVRGRDGIVLLDARVVPVGRRPDGTAIVLGRKVAEDELAAGPPSNASPADA
jgi:DNA-binding transcriptional MerR regulator